MHFAFLSLFLLSLIFQGWSAEVLISPSGLFPVHRYTMKNLAEELIKRGHTVTWFEYGFQKPDIPLPKGTKEIYVEVTSKNQNLRDLYEHRNHSFHEMVWYESEWDKGHQSNAWLASIELCDSLLTSRKTKQIFDTLVNKKFDAVVVDDLYNPCGLIHTGLQHSVFIYWSMTGLRTESAWANQSPSPPSYIPVYGTGYTDDLNFFQRGYNFLSYLKEIYIHQHLILRRIDKLSEKHYPGKLVEAFYMERNASINFVNHPPIFDFARPYMPRVNFVGGLHCRKARKLPPILQKFIDEANDEKGFILLSVGFTFQWKYAPRTVKLNILEAFHSLPEIKFIWQYDGEPIANLPKNIHIASWLPQQDLLGHPKCRGHISTGGINSVIESVWHGVPVIGWPLTIWGYDNLLRVTARHSGFMLDKKILSKQEWISAIHRIYIKYYKDEMLLFQDMVVDVPYTELNHSAFWVEFIHRHQEVPHARSGADELNIIQYFLIDVIAFLISCLILTLYVLYYLIKFTLKSIWFVITLPIRMIFGFGKSKDKEIQDIRPGKPNPKSEITKTTTTTTTKPTAPKPPGKSPPKTGASIKIIPNTATPPTPPPRKNKQKAKKVD
uniref:Glucuronosyltransferase n=2 Tax=Panagrolaimus sp. PS1159 TaxID=55785 RepID=A0AC35FGB6_9BILA